MPSQEYLDFVAALKSIRYTLSIKTIALQYHFRNREEENYEEQETKIRNEKQELQKLVKEGEDLIVSSRISSKKLKDFVSRTHHFSVPQDESSF